MNTLALNFGYRPYTDVDRRPGFDPRSTPQMLGFLLEPRPASTILKSHHSVELIPLLPRIAERFEVFYVLRDPRDALLSFWRYIWNTNPETGPWTATVGAFLRAAPSGYILRYQYHPAATMVERWRLHVEGWTAAAANPAIRVVRYDDLDERFEESVARLAESLGTPIGEPRRPSPSEGVIQRGKGGSGGHRAYFTAADHDFVREAAGATMRRLGYAPD
jgi:hypothetical protein